MKNILIGISLIVLLASCGSGTDSKEQETTNQDISISSWDFITEYEADPENYLSALKGKTITITNMVISYGDESYLVGLAYDGSQLMSYSDHFIGYTVYVDGMLMPEYKGAEGYFYLYENIIDESKEIIKYDYTVAEIANADGVKEARSTYHTIVSIEVSGDDIILGDTGALTITGGKIVELRNM